MIRYLIAKSDKLYCLGCGNNILYGEHYIGNFYTIPNAEKNIRKGLFFHVTCYCDWYKEKIFRKYEGWKATLTEPKKRGRPKIYKDGKEVHRVKVLLYYHKKAGNDDRVQELQAKLDRFRA